MVKIDKCFEDLLYDFDFYLYNQIERAEYDINLSFFSWDELFNDIKMYIEASNLISKSKKILDIQDYLEKLRNGDEFVESVLSKLSERNHTKE